jgi:hypothetical protein
MRAPGERIEALEAKHGRLTARCQRQRSPATFEIGRVGQCPWQIEEQQRRTQFAGQGLRRLALAGARRAVKIDNLRATADTVGESVDGCPDCVGKR